MRRKGTRRDHREAAKTLAKALHQAIRAHDLRSPGKAFPIDDAVSRILENDPDYQPPRARALNKKRLPTANPGIFTVVAIANRLGTTVGQLLRERSRELLLNDRLVFRWISDYLRMTYQTDELTPAPLPDDRSFIENEFSVPRPLTTTRVEVKGEIAAGIPIQTDFDVAAADLIGATKTTALFAARVKGRSMQDRIRDGDTIVIDSAQTVPRQSDPVAVYIENEGGVLGYWRVENGAYFLDKHNRQFGPVRLGHPSEWRVLGLITLVQSRVTRQDRPTSSS